MPSEKFKHYPFLMEWFDEQGKLKPVKQTSFVAQFIHDFGNDTLLRITTAASALADIEYKAFNAALYGGEPDAGDTELKWALGRVMVAGYLNRKAWRDANGIAPSFGEFKNWLMPKSRADWIGDYDFASYEVSTLDDESDDDPFDDTGGWELDDFDDFEASYEAGEDDGKEDEVVLNIPKWMPHE